MTNVNPFVSAGPSGQVMAAPPPGAPDPNAARFMPSPIHTIVIVEMPTLTDILKALDDENPAQNLAADGKAHSPGSSNEDVRQPPHPLPPSMGRSLPLLFIRSSDGIGYHSGRTIACENVFHSMELNNIAAAQQNGTAPGNIDSGWIAAAQAAAAAAEGGMHGWTLRVL